MKHKLALTTLLIAGLTAFAGAPAAAQNAQCSAATLAGEWAFTVTGVIITPGGPVPIAAVARFTKDASGHFTGSQTRNNGGTPGDETFEGTEEVKEGCSTEVTVDTKNAAGDVIRRSTVHVQYDQNATHARGIYRTVIALPSGTVLPSVLTLDGSRVFPGR